MKIKISIIIVLFCVMGLYAHDVGTHWYVGLQTLDIWQNYDPQFYSVVNLANTDVYGVRARKFYLVGLALPDIIEQQDGIRSLVDELYALRGGSPPYPMGGSGFHIEDWTKNQVQTAIEFNGDNPNANLVKLREMADWARDNLSFPEDKAVIYGALMHVIHDLYAHMLHQPSRFGYGKVYQGLSDMGTPITPFDEPIYLAEHYYELFTPTYVPNWNFVALDLFRAFRWDGQLVLPGAEAACADLWHVYNQAGQVVYGFQDGNFESIEKFIDAANAVGYGTSSLTRERLEAYIHGAFVGFFSFYGYEKGGDNIGGIVGHPNWTFSDIADFLKNIGEDNFTVGNYWPLYFICVKPWSADAAITFLHKVISSPLNVFGWGINYAPWLNLADNIVENYNSPWYVYLQSVAGIDSLWDAIPDFFDLGDDYEALRKTVVKWNEGTIKKPNLRSSYSNEIGNAVAIKEFYRQSLLQGSSYFDYHMGDKNMYQVMRKQGPLGGFSDVPDQSYIDQPVILDMYFKYNANPVWDKIEIPISNHMINLDYELFKFGRSRIQIWGKGNSGSTPPDDYLSAEEFIGGYDRHTGSLNFNALDATDNGHREASFRAETWSVEHYQYWPMIDSDYREGCYPVRSFTPYLEWFNRANPTREIGQDPINDPMHYWPYVLRIVSLKRPTGLDCEEIFPDAVKLTWSDNSDLEDGFKIARKIDDGRWFENYKTVVGADITQYTDTVLLCRTYTYKIRAYDNHGRTSDWSDEQEYTAGALGQSDYPKMSAFNSNCKVMRSADGKIHSIYYDGDDVYYTYSTDNGTTFAQWEFVCDSDTIPALYLDNNGVPWVINATYYYPNDYTLSLEYYLHERTEQGWQISYDAIYRKDIGVSQPVHPPPFLLYPPSFVIVGDSGYIAFRDIDGGVTVSSFHLGVYIDYAATQITDYSSNYPSIGYDGGASKIVVLVHGWAYGTMNLYYRTIGSSNWNTVMIDENCEAWGSPSLWTGTNEIRVTFEGYDVSNVGIIFTRLTWSGSTYDQQATELVSTNFDYSDGIEGYSYLASKDVVLWKFNNEIYYARRPGSTWSNKVNISNSGDVSSYAQGIVYTSAGQKLFALWTEESGDNYYLVRKVINLPSTWPWPRTKITQSDILEATGYTNSQRLILDESGTLHLGFTSGDNVYHTFLQDSIWSEPVLIGEGKYPALCSDTENTIYSVFAHNSGSPDFLEELRFTSQDENGWNEPPISLVSTYNTNLWGVGAPSFVADGSIGYFVFESYQGPLHSLNNPISQVINLDSRTVIFGKFPLNNPEECQYQILDTVFAPISIDTTAYLDSIVKNLCSASITIDPEGIIHILWKGDGDSLRYYQIQGPEITKQITQGTIDHPLIKIRGDEIDHFWCENEQIKHHYGWTKTTALSNTKTIAQYENPFSSGPYLVWIGRDGGLSYLYYGIISASGQIEPIEIYNTTNLIYCPQILYNPEKTEQPASLDIIWTEYDIADSLGTIYHCNLSIEQIPPIYAFDMGTETPLPILIQRDDYLRLGDEDYQTIDYDSTELIYHLALHSENKKYKIRWTYYHQEPDKLKLQFNVDEILHKNTWVEPNEKVIEESWIPSACLEDNEIAIRVQKLEGTISVLSGIEIYEYELGGGGPQGEEQGFVRPFFFANIYPNPMKGILKIRFNSPDERKVTVKLYDVVGRLVEKVFDGKAQIGMNEVLIMPKDLAIGIYFVRLVADPAGEAEGYNRTEKVILLR